MHDDLIIDSWVRRHGNGMAILIPKEYTDRFKIGDRVHIAVNKVGRLP